MANILSRTWKLLWNATAIGQLQSVNLTLGREEIDITNYDSNQWKQIEVGDKSWSIEIEGNYDRTSTEAFDQLFEDWDSGTSGTALLSTAVSGDTTLTGSAKITSLNKSGSKGDILKFTATISGTGPLTKGAVV